MKTTIPLLLLAAAPVCASGSEVYRCAAGGSVSYQEFPCTADAREVKIALPQSFPEVNAASRGELLAREAALDKRLEAERDRLSREEIARKQAAAQVAAAQALAAPPAEPVYYAAIPYRPYGYGYGYGPGRNPARPMPRNPSNPWSPR